MDNLPDAAFDNLYKLAAIGGLALIIAASWIYVHAILDLQQQANAYNIDLAEIKGDLEWREAQAGVSATGPTLDLRSVPQDIAKSSARLAGQRAAIESNGVWKGWFAGGWAFFSLIGAVMTGWGFGKWSKIQHWQDTILQAEAEEARQRLAGGASSKAKHKSGGPS